MSPTETNGFSKPHQSSIDDLSQSPPPGFTAVNTRQSIDGDTREPDPRLERLYSEANTGNVTIVNGRSIKGASPTVRAALMKRFFSSTDRETRTEDDHRRSSANAVIPQLTPGSSSQVRIRSNSVELVSVQQVKGGPTVAIPSTPASLLPVPKFSFKDLDDGGPYKSEMVKHMDTMFRGERVIPPCDRCRRLHMDCLKNLTACMGCTKKHAKCSWRDVSVDELQNMYANVISTTERKRDGLTSNPSPARQPSPYEAPAQPTSYVESARQIARDDKDASPAQATNIEARGKREA